MRNSRRGGPRVIAPHPAGMISLVLALLLAMPIRSHEDIEIQVAEITRRMGIEPEKATLHLRRAELHRLHRDWPAALSDYQSAIELDPDLRIVHLSLGRLFLDADLPAPALVALDRFIASVPEHPEAHLLRARIFLRLERRLDAAAEFTRGIDLGWTRPGSRGPRPDDDLDRARALAAEGEEHVDAAIRGLDDGARKLRGAISLRLLALDIEVAHRRWDAALERLSAIEALSPRKEKWLARRGEVLAEAGRPREAREAFESALEAIEALPGHCRGTRAVSELAARIRDVLSTIPVTDDSRLLQEKERT
jgi:tetratricopeptide (TPR) repeat protein